MVSMRVTLARPDLTTLGLQWRALEERADPSFFQSWTWLGCQVESRFHDPVLLRATHGEETVALGLFNRSGRTLWLHETGDPALDAPFIERNGLLTASAHAHRLPELFAALPGRLALSGVDDATAQAAGAGRAVVAVQSRAAPVLDLACSVLDTVSANTRAQLRRAVRRFEQHGDLRVERAEDVGQALAMLSELMQLHTARWSGRGLPGAFADPRTVAFHRTLISRGVDRDEVDLLRIDAGGRRVGLLYNLRRGGAVFAYQGGFDFPGAAAPDAGPQLKPGLVCHMLAAEWYRARGLRSYDFGAGDARYKRSLSTRADTMHWLTLAPRWSPEAGLALLRRGLTQVRRAS